MGTALDDAAASFERTLRRLGLSGDEPELGDAAQFGQWAALAAAAGARWHAQGVAADDPHPPCTHCGPAGAMWHVRFGPLVDTRYAQALLGVPSHEALHDLIEGHRLLAVISHGGQVLIPLFQFGDDGRVHPAVAPVLSALGEAEATGWKMAVWLFTARTELDGQAPLVWLKAGREVAPVLAVARDAPPPRAVAQVTPA
jgi:hypothetical protein